MQAGFHGTLIVGSQASEISTLIWVIAGRLSTRVSALALPASTIGSPVSTAVGLAAGVDWPRSCRNGSCRSCLAQVEVGSVRYRIDWPGLTPEEKEWGCILPCVAEATSDLVMRRP